MHPDECAECEEEGEECEDENCPASLTRWGVLQVCELVSGDREVWSLTCLEVAVACARKKKLLRVKDVER